MSSKKSIQPQQQSPKPQSAKSTIRSKHKKGIKQCPLHHIMARSFIFKLKRKGKQKKNHSNHADSNGSYEGRERPRRTGEGENQRPPFPKETRRWRQRASHAEHSLFHLAGKTFTKTPHLQYNHENATTHGHSGSSCIYMNIFDKLVRIGVDYK